ncbi:unnamed protein product [Phytophthora fragariaefolia]|uniref:Unnamed protein product n=1 Tax=Phytophthora fragariaefolia TaxID=1490495 RepID=A0A9W7CWB2_9STRA|nr:unnamed protein product [Phytophthora fragariaefolia]
MQPLGHRKLVSCTSATTNNNDMKFGQRPTAATYDLSPPSLACSSKGRPRAALALVNGQRDFQKANLGDGEPVGDNNRRVVDTSTSYSDELMAAFKRKTQELCDETREQYEQRLERQEAQHERQVQSLQRQLREVVGSCVSLTEHEQILASTAQEQQHQLEAIRARYQSEMREFEQRCDERWQSKMAALKKQSEQEKSQLTQRVEQLELQRSEAEAEVKERELSELRWGEKLEAVGRDKAAVEKRVDDTKNRLEEACRIIVALRTRLRHHKKLAHDLEAQRDKNSATRDEVMQCKLAYAELKGEMDSRVPSLERELDHAVRGVADEKTNTRALQVRTVSEVVGLREQLQQQQCAAAELAAQNTLRSEHHSAERQQLQKEVEALQRALQQEREAGKEAAARLDKSQQRAAEAQLQQQVRAKHNQRSGELTQLLLLLVPDLGAGSAHAAGAAAGGRGLAPAAKPAAEAARGAAQGPGKAAARREQAARRRAARARGVHGGLGAQALRLRSLTWPVWCTSTRAETGIGGTPTGETAANSLATFENLLAPRWGPWACPMSPQWRAPPAPCALAMNSARGGADAADASSPAAGAGALIKPSRPRGARIEWLRVKWNGQGGRNFQFRRHIRFFRSVLDGTGVYKNGK